MKKTALFTSIILFLAGCTAREPVPVTENEPSNPVKELKVAYNDGTVLVQFDEQMTALIESGSSLRTKAADLDAILEDLGVTSLERVFPDAGPFEERTRREGLHRFYRLRFAEDRPVTKAAGDLSVLPGVVSAHPELPVRSRAANYYNDPYFSSQWHYINSRYPGADINVKPVWEEFTKGDPRVIVSVVDEGVDMDQPDLVANLVPAYTDGTGSFNFTNNTYRISPSSSHGSHVAGVICAVSNNGVGVAGVAGGDAQAGIEGVRVMSCQIFGGYGTPDIYQAMKHGADHGASILQCSWGFSPDVDGDGFTSDAEMEAYCSWTIDDLPEYKAAIDYFIKYAGCDNQGNQLPDAPMKGGVVIFASGNDNFHYDPMVSYEEVIAVGAFGATGSKAAYSNWGDWLDIAAPGGDGKQGVYSTLMGNAYGGPDWLGTSFACPHVSAVAALLVSYFGGPGFTAAECKARILKGAVPNAFPDAGGRYIGKKLDAYGAFTCDWTAATPAPHISWGSSTVPSSMAFNQRVEIPLMVHDPSGQAVFVTLQAEETDGATLESLNGYTLVIDAQQAGTGDHEITLVARNEDHQRSTLVYAYKVLPNAAPVAGDRMPARLVLPYPGEARVFALEDLAYDPEGGDVHFAAEAAQGKVEVTLTEEELQIAPLGLGDDEVRISVLDAQENVLLVNVPVRVVSASEEMTVYPVPVETNLFFRGNGEVPQVYHVTLISDTGITVLERDLRSSAFEPGAVDVKNLAPGLYRLLVKDAEGRTVLSRSLPKV